MTKERDSFIRVHRWMIELPLKRNDLLVYALIYNMATSANMWVRLSITQGYIQKYFDMSLRTVQRIIKRLEDRELVTWYYIDKTRTRAYFTNRNLAIKCIDKYKHHLDMLSEFDSDFLKAS